MPLYDFYCDTCKQTFETFCKISEKEVITNTVPFVDCPDQSSACNIKMVLGLGMNIGDSWHVGQRRVDRAFRDRLQDIKRTHQGSKINIPP